MLCINDLPDDVIYNIVFCADETTLYTKCDQTSVLWQQLALASELESDFKAGKTQRVLFDCSENTGAIDVKIDGSVLVEKLSFKMLGLPFFSNLD